MGFQEIDNDGYVIGDRYIKTKDFLYDNSAIDQLDIIKSSITAALGEIANQSWIDGVKFSNNKAYATIYLGRLGLIFGDKYYTPILRYPKGRQGNTFWISATNDKGNFSAKTIIITEADISDVGIEHNAIAIQNATYYRQWLELNEERRKDNLTLIREPKKVNDREFIKSHEIIRNTGEKSFFVIYILGSRYNAIDFARKAGGANISLQGTEIHHLLNPKKLKKHIILEEILFI